MREALLQNFLEQNNLGTALRQPLAGDASTRRYERLNDREHAIILMDAAPPEDVAQFVKVAEILKAQGYSPPDILATDINNGFLLLEDFGNTLFARLLETGASEAILYELATDFLIDLAGKPVPAGLPAFSDDYISAQNDMFLDGYIPEHAGVTVTAQERSTYTGIWQSLMPEIRVSPDVLLLRDFHAENLLLLEDRPGLQALGLLDFQDALTGPAAYDLVSLLQDARRDVSAKVAERMITHYLEKTSVNEQAFRCSYAILGAHRALRIMGIFVGLAKTQGKLRYLEMLPRMQRHLRRNLSHSALGELKGWLETYLKDAT